MLSEKKKELLREFVSHTCECCGRTEFELSNKAGFIIKLQPHRIKQGGEYKLNNIQMCCDYPDKIDGRYACHKIFTSAQNRARGIVG